MLASVALYRAKALEADAQNLLGYLTGRGGNDLRVVVRRPPLPLQGTRNVCTETSSYTVPGDCVGELMGFLSL